MDECKHDNVEWDPGNHVPPYGWEIYPGYYCHDCGQMVPDREPEERDHDLDRDHDLESRMEDTL